MKSGLFFLSCVLCLTAVTSLEAEDAPRIEMFSPQGTVKGVRQVSARFSEPMVPLGDPRGLVEPFDVSCPEKGAARWADGKNWVLDFDRDLPAGVRCEFTIKPGLRSLVGKEITGQRNYAFSTGGPAIKSTIPQESSYASIDEEQIFILTVDGEPAEQSILSHVTFSVAGIRDHVGVRIVSGNDREQVLRSRFRTKPAGTVIVLQAKQRFPVDSNVGLIWGKGVTSKSGVATEEDQRFHFRTRKPFVVEFHCERENPKAACLPITNMSMTFPSPVSWDQAGQIVLKGPNNSTWKAERGENEKEQQAVSHVLFKAPFPEKTDFAVELPAGLTDDADRGLANADKFPLQVRTHDFPPLAKFPATFGIIELNADPVLPVTVRNIEPEVKARMLKIGQEKDLIGKAADVLEELKGKVMKVETKKGDDLQTWLNEVFAHVEYGNERGNSLFDSFAKKMQTKTFTIPKPNGAKAFEVVGIPLKGPGLYIVEIESAVLGSALHENQQPMFVPAAALVTNLSAHFKWGQESSLVWVTTLDKAQPVKDAAVTARDCGGSVLWQGKTDENGIARIVTDSALRQVGYCQGNDYAYPFNGGVLITVESSEDMTFVHSSWQEGIEPWRFQLPVEWHGGDAGPAIAHSILDRTLFRAGETVHMKHILRRPAMNGFAMVPEAERPKALAIQHQGTWQIYELPLTWDSLGVVETTWTVPKEAKLGVYDVVLIKDSYSDSGYSIRYAGWHTGKFRVEEFRVPLMRGIIRTPEKPLIAASQATVDIAVQYLAGGGAGELAVKLRSQVQPKIVTPFEGFTEFVFANGPVKEGVVRRGEDSSAGYAGYEGYEGFGEDGGYESQGEPPAGDTGDSAKQGVAIQSTDLMLDHAGGARVTIAKLPKVRRPMDLLTELEFRDPNGEVQTVSSKIPLWPAKRLVGLKPDSWVSSKDALKFHVVVVDLTGKPVAGTQVSADLFERKTYSHRKRLVGGFYAFEHLQETKRLAVACAGKTDSRGLLICEAKSPVSGNVVLQAKAKDESGRESVANRDVWVAGKDDWWFGAADHDRMDLLPERKRYEPGEIARFQVRMPFRQATALVTVEREGVIDTFVRPLSGKVPFVEVPIKGHYGPNVFVSVLAVRGRVSGVQPTALVDLGRPAYKLGIAEINVGWKAYELKVTVRSDRQMYKVRDKARVRITVKTPEGKAPPDGSEVAVAAVDEGLLELLPNKSWQILEAMMGRRSYAVNTSTAQMHVVGKRHFGLKALPQGGGGGRQTTRELFDTLLLWKGRVPLNQSGEATVEIPLNDSLTGFRIVAVAMGRAGLFGTGGTSIRSTQDLMILSGAAPLVRSGDRFRSEFTVRNTTGKAMEVTLAGRVAPLPDPLAPMTLALAPGEAKEIGWELAVPAGVDTLSYEIEAKEKGGNADRIKIKQKVVQAVPVRTFQATITQIDKGIRVPVERPVDAVLGMGSVSLLFRPSLADGLGGVIEYMKRYSYHCLEQEVSRAVALRDTGHWKQVMGSLPSYLDRDGLAKYFTQMTQGSDVLTAYLLAIAHEAGWDIPPELREKMESALKKFVAGSLRGHSPLTTADLSLRKLAAIEALTRTGHADPSMLTSITIEPNLWPTSAVIDWLSILQRLQGVPKREERVKEAEQILRSRLNFQGTTMGFSTERSDALWWLMISNDVNSVRLVLSLLNAPQWKEDMPRLVRGALGRQRRGAWDLTVANAWGVLAVEKFAKAFESTPVSGTTTAILSSQTSSVEWAIAPKGAGQQFDWPSQREELTVRHVGLGKPWVTVQILAAIPLKEPVSSGYRIKKTVTPIVQRLPGNWSKGDLARVRLEVEAQSDMTWVVVSDPIPGGGTILGGALGRDSQMALKGEEKKGCACGAFEERSFEAFRAYYEYVPKGSFTVEYTVRFNQSGTYLLPPTRVEAMYSPEMLGEIPNEKIEVGL